MQSTDLVVVVELAPLTPSVHNIQPWSFTWDGVSLGIREDSSRALPVLDPSGRERIVSCGAAVLHARLGFAERGWDVATVLLPDAEDSRLLARLTVRGRREGTAEEHALAAAIPVRSTDRDPFDRTPVTDAELDLLRAAAEREGAWVRAMRASPSAQPPLVLGGERDVVLPLASSGVEHAIGRRQPCVALRAPHAVVAARPLSLPAARRPCSRAAVPGLSLRERSWRSAPGRPGRLPGCRGGA